MFKQWFVDFEFPNEEGLPYKSSGGEMVESELGMIPKGWRVGQLGSIAAINIGRTPPRNEHQWFTTNDFDVKWISIRDMGNCGVFISETSEYLTESAVKKFNIPQILPNTVILSFKLTVGRVAITTERMLSNEAIAHVNPQTDIMFPEFFYLYLKQFDYDSLSSTSSIATAVNSKTIKCIPIILPNNELLMLFKKTIDEVFVGIKSHTIENKNLINLRNTLLPKLISGELEVTQALSETEKAL
jgi:type I restriction enzyme, S subunit